jgi:hypothetical protein
MLYKMTHNKSHRKGHRKIHRKGHRKTMKGGFLYGTKSNSRKYTKSRKNTRQNTKRVKNRSLKGGTYHQFLSNTPYDQGYSIGGQLSPSQSALANPAPYTPYYNMFK